jgi:hypothetical protein
MELEIKIFGEGGIQFDIVRREPTLLVLPR